MDEIQQTKFEGWALVEIMGHRRAAGLVTTEYIGSAAFLRVVTPEVLPTEVVTDRDAYMDGSYCYAGSKIEISRPRTEILIGSASIYALTPITEEEVLEHAPLRKTIIERAERKGLSASIDDTDDSDREEP